DLAEASASSADSRLGSAKARLASLEAQNAELVREIQSKGARISERGARADELQQRLRAAQANYDGAASRLRDLQAASGLRGERLRVIDPGVVPERPSSPNVPLNVMLAIAVALIGCLAYVTLTFRAA